MNFIVHKQETRDRYNEVLLYLNHTSSLEPDPVVSPGSIPIELKILRGLAYVHIYGAFERSISDLLTNILLSINSYDVIHFHFIPQFNTIAAGDILKSFKDSSYKKFIPKATEMLNTLVCRDVPNINETIFSNDLQNLWYKTIVDLRRAFGMNDLPSNPRLRLTINEVVENRNAVAHGRKSPVEIGSAHNSSVIRNKFTTVQNFNYELIDQFESYYNNKKFIKPTARRYY